MFCLFKTNTVGDDCTYGVSFDTFIGFFSSEEAIVDWILIFPKLELREYFYIELQEGQTLQYEDDNPGSILDKYRLLNKTYLNNV